MNLLTGLTQIRQLPDYRQRRFQRFYRHQSRYRVLPLFADVSLTITFIGTLLFLVGQASGTGISGAHLLYTAILLVLFIAHRTTRLRRTSPLIVYLVFAHMALFSYLGYIASGGALETIIGLFFFLSSAGLITLSLRHTLIIHGLNLGALMAATYLAVGPEQMAGALTAVLSNWLILMCLIIAPLSAWFFSLLLKNLMALQFLLRDRNRQLSRTLRTLAATEERLVQEQKHQALSHMAKGLLHEFMNPLNCASQAVDYAAAINRDPDIGEALEDASVHQKRMANIVSDLIEFSRPEPDHNLELASVAELVDRAIRFCRHELRDIPVKSSVPEGLSLPCYPSAITQVLVNLLLNAASALRHDSRATPGRIDITAALCGNSVALTVQDNGRGIAPEAIERLTDPFYSTGNSPDNLGLGLSVCQTIMRHHRGQMDIRSEPGQWTRVTLTLPLDRTTATH